MLHFLISLNKVYDFQVGSSEERERIHYIPTKSRNKTCKVYQEGRRDVGRVRSLWTIHKECDVSYWVCLSQFIGRT